MNDESEDVIRVRIEDTTDGRQVRVRGDDLAATVADAVITFRPPRPCEFLAALVDEFQQSNAIRCLDIWPGHREAFDDLLDAAFVILNGWRAHDKKLRANVAAEE